MNELSYDANGNISDYVDTNGTVVAHREYDAYGNAIVATGSMVNDFNFWFSTKYLDQETGLYYYGYRYYDPVTGRWLSEDPLGERAFLRQYQTGKSLEAILKLTAESYAPLYLYVKNDPVSLIDPLGLESESMRGVFWMPDGCPRSQTRRFIQVGHGGWFNYNVPFVDNGSYGWGASSTGSALYPEAPSGFFQDTPSGLTGPVQFEVCRVCLCGNKVQSFGPCRRWQVGDSGDLGPHPGGYASQQFINTVNNRFPGTLGQ